MRFTLHLSRLRALLVAGTAAMAIAAAPATADAASIAFAGGTVTYSAAKDEINHVTVETSGVALRITETGTKQKSGASLVLKAGSGCTSLSSNSAACPVTATKLTADLTDGDDFFDAGLTAVPLNVKGGLGADTLRGGNGADTLDGGADNDSIEARDGAADQLVCGAGSDSGYADLIDTVPGDCEAVQRATSPQTIAPDPAAPTTDPLTGDPLTDPITPTGEDPAGGDPTADPTGDPSDPPGHGDGPTASTGNTIPATIPPQTVGVSPSGVATVRVDCPAGSGGCSGTVRLEIPSGPAVKRPGHAKTAANRRRNAALTIGSAKFKAKPGTSATVRVRLSKRGRQRIARSRRGRRARIVVTTRRADGTTSVATQEVTLKVKRQATKKRSGRR